ncbi:MAG TPA: hypothetical protein VN380_06825 [Thermoanaerobaculia bacterium]|nr:hypothetical protein [Thermoanaerobaculia bacterium]
MTNARTYRPDFQNLVNAKRSLGSIAGVAKVALFKRGSVAPYRHYFDALHAALHDEEPPFGSGTYANVYRDAASEGQWLAVSLITNAEREGDGATRLWSLAACSADEQEQQLLKRHAVDESRHALAYLALLDLTFPDAVDAEFRGELNALSPHYSMAQEVHALEGSPYARCPSVDDYMQMNIAEIRTTIHHMLQRAAIAEHCPAANLARATNILDSLLRDELRHVAYTAELIDHKAAAIEPDALRTRFCKRMKDFSDITRQELGQFVFD